MLDLTLVVLYAGGFAVRLHEPGSLYAKVVAKSIFAMSNLLLFAHIGRYYGASTTLGPKVQPL
jgi:hypothetical protein